MKNLFNKNIIISPFLFVFALALFLLPNITKIEATTFILGYGTVTVNLNSSAYKPGNTITVSSSADILFAGKVYAEIVNLTGTTIGSNKTILSTASGSNVRSSSIVFTAPSTLADYTMKISAYYNPTTDSSPGSYCYGNGLAIQGLCDPSSTTISIPFTVHNPILSVYANNKISESFINSGNVNIYWIPNFDSQSCTCKYDIVYGLDVNNNKVEISSKSCGGTTAPKSANTYLYAGNNKNNSYPINKSTTFKVSCDDGANCSDPCSGTYSANTLGSQIDWNGTAMAWVLNQGYTDSCRVYYVSSCDTTSCKWQYDQYDFYPYGGSGPGGSSASGYNPTCGNDIGNAPIATNIIAGNARIITTTNNSCIGLSQSSCVSYSTCSWNSGSTCSVGSTAASPVNGLCGTTNNSCTVGTFLDNTDTSSNYLWTCSGSNGGANDYCSIFRPLNGSCGTLNNICTAGALHDITDNSYFYLWNCNGSFGGSIAYCSLSKTAGGGGGGAGGCFIAGTKVTMANGTLKNIEDITINDTLLSSIGPSPVMKRYVIDYYGKLYSMNGSKYFVSDSHPFKTIDGWKSFDPIKTKIESPTLKVSQLHLGDIFIREDGTKEILESFSYKYDHKKVYNFGLNGSRDYYADGYLVHNVDTKPIQYKILSLIRTK